MFAEGEQLEHVKTDSTAALRVYEQLAGSTDASVRAGALARVARVRRKLGDVRGALQAYRELESIGQTSVEGLPSSLVARAGRATLFQDTHRVADLASEAAGLQQDLGQGRWQLLRAEYDFDPEQAGIWLGVKVDDRRARARAEAADWLGQTAGPKGPALQARQPVDSAQPSATLLSGPVLAVQFGTDALVAGPDYVESLCAEAVARPFRCALSDSEDRTVTGDRPPGRMTAVRTASAIALPWTLHVLRVARRSRSSHLSPSMAAFLRLRRCQPGTGGGLVLHRPCDVPGAARCPIPVRLRGGGVARVPQPAHVALAHRGDARHQPLPDQ